jgi:hypothetical protein
MMDATLSPTTLIDSDHPAVAAFAARHGRGADDRERIWFSPACLNTSGKQGDLFA